MKEPFTPMNLAIVQLEALDILTTSIISYKIIEATDPTLYGETPPIAITGATPNS